MQERRNSIANALELRLSCTNPSIYGITTNDALQSHSTKSPTQLNAGDLRIPYSDWFFATVLFLQYIPRNMHTVFALLCYIVVIHWLIFPYPSGLLHWHCGNLTIAPVPAKQPWWIWINTSCEFIMCDCITTTKQSTTKPCAYFLGCTVYSYTSFCCKCLFR